MENKYSKWIEVFKETISEKESQDVVDKIFNNSKNCEKISNDSEMAQCVRNIMKKFEKVVPEDFKRFRIMESIGTSCASPMLQKVREISENSKNLPEKIEDLNKLYGGDFFYLKGDKIYSKLGECVCHYGVTASNEPISPTYCRCSCGYMKILFETLLGEPVKVNVTETILTGGNKCKFIVTPKE
jgi:predicted ArsR family transcriptional regulator